MTPNVAIAIRFLVHKRGAMFMSLAGIVFGVGLFILTQAQTSGFERFFIDTILGADGAVRIEDKLQDTLATMVIQGANDKSSAEAVDIRNTRKFIEGIENPQEIADAVKQFENVSGVSVIVQGDIEVDNNARRQPGRVAGVNIDDHLKVTNLGNQIILGDLEDFRSKPQTIMVGTRMAVRMQLRVGDLVTLTKGTTTGLNVGRFRVAAIFETGIEHIDKQRVFMHLAEARSLLGRPFGANVIQVGLLDANRAVDEARSMERALHHVVIPWQEREKVWLDVFKALRISSAITVSTIILISGLGMFNTLAMMVLEKTKEISILRSMGYTRRDISDIFLWQGLIILVIGTVLGWVAGAGMTWAISSIPIRIRGIFSTDSFVVNWSFSHYVAAALTAAVVVIIASYIPARRAARLEPGDVIRGTSG